MLNAYQSGYRRLSKHSCESTRRCAFVGLGDLGRPHVDADYKAVPALQRVMSSQENLSAGVMLPKTREFRVKPFDDSNRQPGQVVAHLRNASYELAGALIVIGQVMSLSARITLVKLANNTTPWQLALGHRARRRVQFSTFERTRSSRCHRRFHLPSRLHLCDARAGRVAPSLERQNTQ